MTQSDYVVTHQKLMAAISLKDPELVKELQAVANKAIQAKNLKIKLLKEDGFWGEKSRAALQSLRPLFGLKPKDAPTLLDLRVLAHPFSLCIEQEHLPNDEYFAGDTAKKGIVLHHTASDGNPHNVGKFFDKDKRGRVAVHYVVGGTILKAPTEEEKSQFDGKILQLFPLEDFGAHLMTSANNRFHDSTTIAIEVCSYGGLKKDNKGNFINEYNGIMPASEVETLPSKFNGYQHFHRYTDKQCESLLGLICYLRDIFEFDFSQIHTDLQFFACNVAMINNKVVCPLTAHTSWRKVGQKSDIYPSSKILPLLEAVKKFGSYEEAASFYKKNLL